MLKKNIYLITGGSGTIGSEILKQLLLRKDAFKIFVLLRSVDLLSLQSKFADLSKYWKEDQIETNGIIVPIKGDVSLPNFGLHKNDFELIVNEVTHLVHAAGNVRMNFPLEEARNEILTSTENLIRFSEHLYRIGCLEKIEYISTIGVAGRMRGDIPEKYITHTSGFHNTYEQVKYESEQLIFKSIAEGLPVTTHRPSMVVGSSKTGKILNYQVFYYLTEFLSGKKSAGFLPKFYKSHLDIIPVDYVAKIIVESSLDQSMVGRVLHQTSGNNAISLNELHSICQQKYGNKILIKWLPKSFFKIVIYILAKLTWGKARRRLKTLPWFLAYLDEHQIFCNFETIQFAKQKNISFLDYSEYIAIVLDAYKPNFRQVKNSA